MIAILTALDARAQAPLPPTTDGAVAVEAGPHHRVWQTVTTDQYGRAITNSYTEVETCMNFFEPSSGLWQPSESNFEIPNEGYAVARKGQHQLIVSPALNDANGAVDLLTPDGKRFRSTILGINLYDRLTGKSLLLAELTNSVVGELISPNQVLFPRCFDALDADVRVTYEKDAFHQDVIFHQKLDLDRLAAVGFSLKTARLEVWTEFFEAPEPQVTRTVLESESDPLLRTLMAEPDVVEERLDFGVMQMPLGKAYLQEGGFERAVQVPKQWLHIDQRTFLVESMSLAELEPMLASLPPAKSDAAANINARLYAERRPPSPVLLESTTNTIRVAMAETVDRAKRGLNWDYTTVNTSQTNYIFKRDSTFYLSGNVNLYGTTTWEGGVVLKYASNVSLTANGPVNWLGNAYAPVLMTAKDDDSCGEPIAGSTGNPNTSFYANPALKITVNGAQLHDFRVAHAQMGIFYYDYSAGGGNNGVTHAQFVHCSQAMGVNGYGATFQNFFVRNVLMNNCATAFYGYSFKGGIEHLTLDQCGQVANDCCGYLYGTSSSVSLTNSLLAAVTNGWGNVIVATNATYATNANAFKIVGAGYHYLAVDSSYRNIGTTNINASLAADLKKMTTYAPVVLTNDFAANTNLAPQAPRNTGIPDIGYHYQPLDWCLGGLNLTNATLMLTNGVAIGFNSDNGIFLRTGARFISQGTPLALNRLTRYQTVQEQSLTWGTTNSSMSLIYNLTDLPAVTIRFTDVSLLGDSASRRTFYDSAGHGANPFAVVDSQLRGVYESFPDQASVSGMVMGWTNNLMERCSFTWTQSDYYYPYTLSLYNNLFHNGSVSFTTTTNAPSWTVKDNLFDCDTLTKTGAPALTASNNGYRSGLTNLGGSGNKTGLIPDYQTGPLGNFYYPTNGSSTSLTNLFDAGSRNATNAGLYHYTVRVDQTKETNSMVEIGQHYVALNTNGVPFDSDADGLADCLEDSNGDGLFNTGDLSSWTSGDTDGDGMPDAWEVQNGLNPRANDASDDPDGDGVDNYHEYLNGTNPNDPWFVGWGLNQGGQLTAPAGLGNVLVIDGGYDFTVALRANGAAVAWGGNYYGQTNVPAGLSNLVTAVSAAWYQAAAVKANGTVTAWGQTHGQIPADLTNAVGLSLGFDHGIALRADGMVSLWGEQANSYSTNIPGLAGVKAVAAGSYHNAALLANSTVIAWGEDLSMAGWYVTNVPSGLSNVTAIAAGELHTLALKSDGTVVAWGAGGLTNLHTLADLGQSIVPTGLSNVVAIAAGGYSSMALRNDGTVVTWGELGPGPIALNNVVAIGIGESHALVERIGRQTPVIVTQPQVQCCCAGSNVTFSASAIGPSSVSYQWQFTNANIASATNTSLSLTNVQSGNQGTYHVIVSNGAGSVTSQDATLNVVGPPVLLSHTQPSNFQLLYGATQTLSAQATYSGTCPFPLSYLWYWNGTNVYAPNGTNYTLTSVSNASSGVYSVAITNGAGSTNLYWTIDVAGEGHPVWWGNSTQAWSYLPSITNAIAMAGGGNHTLLLQEGGGVLAWGTNTYGQTNVPPTMTNGVSVAAGDSHSLGLKADGTVIAWGRNDLGQTNVPSNLTNAISISAGGQQSLALRKDTTVIQWGQTFGSVPLLLSNVTAVASGTNFHLAMKANGTVVAWGNNGNGQTSVPASATNVVAIAAGGAHALALRVDGKVVAWGNNASGQTNVPANLTNAMAIAAGYAHSLALRNDGTVVAWGDNTYGQTNTPSLVAVKLIAAGGYQSLASTFSSWLQYPVDVTKDMLLICNTNSTSSAALRDYYLAHRPLVANANVLNVACDAGEFTTTNNCEAQIVTPVLNWLAANPTKHPEYVVLFFDIPTRLTVYPSSDYGSVSYQLRNSYPGWKPLVTHINAGTLYDCEAYIDKLSYIGTNYSPAKLIISASVGSYGNTNYYFDDTNIGYPGRTPGLEAKNGVLSNGVPLSSVTYTNVADTGLSSHITTGTNLAGYLCWGYHSSLGGDYATNATVHWSGNSRWWIIETIESINGWRVTNYGNFIKWFSTNAFGGTSYLNTPVGAVCYVEEPTLESVNNGALYFGLWSVGKNFAISAWNSGKTPYLQAVGDPFVVR